MKIDLHVHTKERSACGRSSEIEQIQAAIDAGLDAIAFTDHERLAPAKRLVQLNEIYAPFRIFNGVEININSEHILVFGIHDSKLESMDWRYPELHAFVRERGGLLAVAHPFRFHPELRLDIEHFPPDAVEAYSTSTPLEAAERILNLTARLDIPTMSNSDSHVTHTLGKHYNILDRSPADISELIEIIRKGQFTKSIP
ncbi:MAG: PHP-associated domain-containing protein [Chloroflexota bacterium]|nr:PHP-associated domain-containing protein [Chloroflexota bacterium]